MKHWSVNPKELRKDKDTFTIWKLEQMINFGLRKGKISKKDLLAYWNQIDIDPLKRKFLSIILAH